MKEIQTEATRILVVEDDDDIRMALIDQLLAMGFDVFQATNGREALDLLSLKTIDGVLVDVEMPMMDGWTMLEQLQRLDSHVPIIVMSAGIPGVIAPMARKYGAQGYLPKPFNFSHLQTTCNRVFGEANAYCMSHAQAL